MRGSFTPFLILFFLIMLAGELAMIPSILTTKAEATTDALANRQTVDVALYTVETFQAVAKDGTGGPCSDGTMGHGITFGPREARQAVVIWDCATGLILEATQYGPPHYDLEMHGPAVAEVTLDLAGRLDGTPWAHLVGLLLGPACDYECRLAVP